jgi:ubiquinone/menaquinone biosynthesis C-methylase UbiE
MGIYRERLVPHLIDYTMRTERIAPFRNEVVSGARGRVLEIGVGSALNLPYYGMPVTSLVGVEPSAILRRKAAPKLGGLGFPAALIDARAEALPFDRESFDTVVSTWTLCSIAEIARGLIELRRVLKPGGSLLFVEHGLSDDVALARWQGRLDPLWCRLSGGCHMNRPIARLIEAAGFHVAPLRTEYGPGPRLLSFFFIGAATPG